MTGLGHGGMDNVVMSGGIIGPMTRGLGGTPMTPLGKHGVARPGVGGTQNTIDGNDGMSEDGPGGTVIPTRGFIGAREQIPGSGGGVRTSYGHGLITPLIAGRGGSGVTRSGPSGLTGPGMGGMRKK